MDHKATQIDSNAEEKSPVDIDSKADPVNLSPDLDLTDEPQSDSGPANQPSKSRKRRRMHCFECNRMEGHFLTTQKRWFYSYLIGLTFGLIFLVGPYQCQCCGAKRLMSHNYLNPRYWLRLIRHGDVPKIKKSSK